MRCEWRQSTCGKPATKRLNIYFRDSGRQNVYYYCESHALMRISELEDDESVEIRSAEKFEMAPSRDES